MPTIDRVGGFSFRIFPNDHAPAHVHVVKGDGMAVIHIGDPAIVHVVFSMKPRDVKQAIRIVEANWKLYRQRWEEIHG
jgi:hypothetical protein